MNQFVVTIIDPPNRASGIGTKLYEGDDFTAARMAAHKAVADQSNIGRYVRFYNFALFAGGMTDTLVTEGLYRESLRTL